MNVVPSVVIVGGGCSPDVEMLALPPTGAPLLKSTIRPDTVSDPPSGSVTNPPLNVQPIIAAHATIPLIAAFDVQPTRRFVPALFPRFRHRVGALSPMPGRDDPSRRVLPTQSRSPGGTFASPLATKGPCSIVWPF